MTVNEILREMLTERGVVWEAFDDFEQTTEWSTHNGAFVYWAREREGKLLVETTAPTKCSASCTPEQAIEVTLGSSSCSNSERAAKDSEKGSDGRGECHMTEMRFPHDAEGSYWMKCDQCGFMVYMRDWWQPVRFCSHCGAKVVGE